MAKRLGKPEHESKMERAARLWMNERGTDYSDGWRGAYRDLAYGGCSSGMVSDLIYTRDTCAFFERHKHEINRALADLISDTGCTLQALLRDWDETDPLALDTNQNLLAWFGFEHAARIVAERNGYDH